jgi:hypothetical protein
MGLFKKLGENLHGGVSVHVQAPGSVPANQVIPVAVTVTSDTSQTINGVKAEIQAQARETGIGLGGMGGGGNGISVGARDERTTYNTVAKVESREPFTLGPGESKTFNFELYINGSAASGNPLAQMGNIGGALGGIMEAAATAVQTFDHINYIYRVHASANVGGHTMDPSDKQAIEILPATAAPAAPESFAPQAQSAAPAPQNPQPPQPPLPPTPMMPMQPAEPNETAPPNQNPPV